MRYKQINLNKKIWNGQVFIFKSIIDREGLDNFLQTNFSELPWTSDKIMIEFSLNTVLTRNVFHKAFISGQNSKVDQVVKTL